MPLLMCDLDDTLVEQAPLFRAWAEQFLADHGAGADLVDWVVEQDRGGFRPREDFAAALLERVGPGVPLEELVAEHGRRLTFESGTEPDLVAEDFADAVRQVLDAT